MRSGLHHTCRWCPVTEYMLSFPGEAKLRKAFGMLNSWTGRGLEMRLREDDIGLASQNAARVLISNGVNAGLLDLHKSSAAKWRRDWLLAISPTPVEGVHAFLTPNPRELSHVRLAAISASDFDKEFADAQH